MATLAAGCTGDSTKALSETEALGGITNMIGTAAIRGQVVDSELTPIAGANVFIDDRDPTSTNEAGVFLADGLAGGVHVAVVRADGYADGLFEFALEEGRSRDVQFIIERAASTAPYIETLLYRGYSFCDEATYAGSSPSTGDGGACGAALRATGNQNPPANMWDITVLGSWRFIISEITWEPTFGGSADSMRLVHSTNGTCSSGDPCYAVQHSTYYGRVEAEPGKSEIDIYYDPYEDQRGPPYPHETFNLTVYANWIGYGRDVLGPTCDLWTPILLSSRYEPGCLGVGYSTGFPWDLWVSIFHYEAPEKGECCPATTYSALPK